MAPSDVSTVRRPYHGSCHCGHTKYVAFLTLPPTITPPFPPKDTIKIGKCNCNTCHKMGYFHTFLKSPTDDFILLSPLDPQTGGLGDYTCNSRKIHYFFCKNCGIRCFQFTGTGEVAEVDESSWGNEEGGKIIVWRPKTVQHLSVNAMSLETGQEGLDLMEWKDKNWIWYFDMKHDGKVGAPRTGAPYEGGYC
jgi:hypothetical protein